MKYIYYVLKVLFSIVEGLCEFIQYFVDEKKKEGFKVGVLMIEEYQYVYSVDVILFCGVRSDLVSVVIKLYDVFRIFDVSEVDVIFSELFFNEGIGNVIMNCLIKVVGYYIIIE